MFPNEIKLCSQKNLILINTFQVDIQVAMVISITIILVRKGLIHNVMSQQN